MEGNDANINQLDEEDLKTAFKKATERIWQKYISQGGNFPDYYVMHACNK